jgi:hypothetical protein
MYNLLLYKVYIYFVKLELQLLNKQNHSTNKGEKFGLFRAFFGCIAYNLFVKKMLKFLSLISKDICTQSAGARVHPRERQG